MEQSHIDLWLTFEDRIENAELLSSYRALLSDEERTQEARFRFPHDRHRYLVARALVRTVLSRYASLRPQQWRFVRDAFGRPRIVPTCEVPVPVIFNLSHTAGLIVLAVTRARAVGVDTECARRDLGPLDIADRYFSPLECDMLNKLPASMRPRAFLSCWTLKESYVKAVGGGLSIPLDSFSIDFWSDEEITISFSSSEQSAGRRWRFWSFSPSLEHVVALCAEHGGCEQLGLTVKEVVPLDFDRPFEGIRDERGGVCRRLTRQ